MMYLHIRFKPPVNISISQKHSCHSSVLHYFTVSYAYTVDCAVIATFGAATKPRGKQVTTQYTCDNVLHN